MEGEHPPAEKLTHIHVEMTEEWWNLMESMMWWKPRPWNGGYGFLLPCEPKETENRDSAT